MIDRHCFKQTQDDWAPSYFLDDSYMSLVKVSMVGHYESEPVPTDKRANMVHVWGRDDSGMERFFETLQEAEQCFLIILGWNYVGRVSLENFGFKRA